MAYVVLPRTTNRESTCPEVKKAEKFNNEASSKLTNLDAVLKAEKLGSLGAFFQPIIISAGGLMELETAKTYKKLQELVGPVAAAQLDATIGLTLTKTRAISAASIAKEIPTGLAKSIWNTSKRSP
ncbi:Uncharacterized protein HZ326_16479 [Fusarium oxysporum f. sp. albedinis]|nr:Uncharacterized protein HZ326_16479 [Fusarium oxysporum f. sp. albedinis]